MGPRFSGRAVRQRHLVMALLCALGVILYIDRICISLALPAIQDELEIAPELLGWISVAFSISYALFEIPSGHLGDRHGARGVLTRITVWWSVFTALTGAAMGFGSLLVTRFLFGAGEAGAWPNASSVVSKWFPSHQRARAMGIFGAATAIGGGLSPLIVIPIQRAYGWRASFFAFAVAGVVWATVWYAWFRDTPAEKGVPADELAELGHVPPRASNAIRWSVALRQPSMWGLIAMDFCYLYTAFFTVFWLPTYLVKGRGFTDDELRWTAVIWVGAMIGNLIGGVISDGSVRRLGLRAGRRAVGAAGMVIVASGILVAALTDSKEVAIGAFTLCAITGGVIQANSFATCIDIGGRHVGTVAGAMNTSAQLGGALSAIAFGYLVKLGDSYDLPLYVMATVTLLGTAGWWAIDASKLLVPDDGL